MKQYSYYDAYHRQRKFPMTIRLHRWRSKRGVFLLSFFIALVLVRFFLWEEITEVAGWSRICLERLDANISDSRNFFWYVVIRRSELLLLLTLCGLTRMRKALYYTGGHLAWNFPHVFSKDLRLERSATGSSSLAPTVDRLRHALCLFVLAFHSA